MHTWQYDNHQVVWDSHPLKTPSIHDSHHRYTSILIRWDNRLIPILPVIHQNVSCGKALISRHADTCTVGHNSNITIPSVNVSRIKLELIPICLISSVFYNP